MRFAFASLFLFASATAASAATQQQCEALIKPVETRFQELEKFKDEKPTPQACARARDSIKVYADYVVKADKMGCPVAYVSGQAVGGKEERAELMAELKKAYAEQCR